MKKSILMATFVVLAGCAGSEDFLGNTKLEAPPEFNQKIILRVSDEYQMHQAPRSGYDVGDLQNFHSQHTLPILVEDAFKEIFGQVDLLAGEQPRIEAGAPDVPAVFEVRIIDLAQDVFNESTSYRSQVTLAVAMKSPRDEIFWQKTFRGNGYVVVDPQFTTGLGPQDAVLDAMRDVLDQMQKAIIESPQVLNQMRYYQNIERARQEKETRI